MRSNMWLSGQASTAAIAFLSMCWKALQLTYWCDIDSDDVRSLLHNVHSLRLHDHQNLPELMLHKLPAYLGEHHQPLTGQFSSTIRSLTIFMNHQLRLWTFHHWSYFWSFKTLDFEPNPGSKPYDEHVSGLKISWLSSSLQNSCYSRMSHQHTWCCFGNMWWFP